MKRFSTRGRMLVAVLVLALVAILVAAAPVLRPTRLSAIHLSCSDCVTATPVLRVNQDSTGKIFEALDAGTPVFSINDGGGWSATGGQTNSSNLVVSAPTAIGTATPAVLINNAGVSKQLEVQDGGVVAFDILNGGGARFTAPTAIATAQPGFVVDSSGVSNIFEIRDAATPVVQVEDGGATRFNHLGFTAQSYTSTGSQTITPTNRTLYNLNPTAALTVTLATGAASTGDTVLFANNVTTATVIVDTGATQGGGNITLGENDNAAFLFLGDAWIELFSPDNS